jgi:hypothetical protein
MTAVGMAERCCGIVAGAAKMQEPMIVTQRRLRSDGIRGSVGNRCHPGANKGTTVLRSHGTRCWPRQQSVADSPCFATRAWHPAPLV